MSTKIHSVEIGVTDEGYYYVSAVLARKEGLVTSFDWLPDLDVRGPEINHYRGIE